MLQVVDLASCTKGSVDLILPAGHAVQIADVAVEDVDRAREALAERLQIAVCVGLRSREQARMVLEDEEESCLTLSRPGPRLAPVHGVSYFGGFGCAGAGGWGDGSRGFSDEKPSEVCLWEC